MSEEPSKEIAKESAKELLKTFDKLSSAVIEPAKERLTHPFVGSFLISLVFFNWKPILYLFFAQETIEIKIDFITNNYYKTKLDDAWHFLIFPLLIAIFYTVVLKWLDDAIAFCTKYPNKKKQDRLADNKINELRNEIRIVNEHHLLNIAKSENKPLEELNMRIEQLEVEINLRELSIDKLKTEVQNKNVELEQMLLNGDNVIKENLTLKSEIKDADHLVNKYKGSIYHLLGMMSGSVDKIGYKKIISKLVSSDIPNDFKDTLKEMFNEDFEENIVGNCYYNFSTKLDISRLEVLKNELMRLDKNITMDFNFKDTKNGVYQDVIITYPGYVDFKKIETLIMLIDVGHPSEVKSEDF